MAELNYLPSSSSNLDDTSFELIDEPSRTYKLDIQKGVIKGMADGVEAVMQAIYLILSIERYQYPIYSRDYGSELTGFIGKPRDYAMSEIERCITEALITDDRISGVDGWSFESLQRSLHVNFTVHTIYGDIETTKEVPI